MFIKSVLLSWVILLSYQGLFAQANFPYQKEWNLIDSLINKKNLPKSALTEVNKVYDAAKKDKLEPQWVKAIIYKYQLQQVDDRNISVSVNDLENEIAAAPTRVASLLKSIEAEQLNQYLQGHRHQMQNRTTMVADTSADFNTWTVNRFNQKICSLYLSSIENAVLLQQTPIDRFNEIIIPGNSRNLRPSLFDLLAWRALDYFRMGDQGETAVSAEQSLVDKPILFSAANHFMRYEFREKDSASNTLTALKIYQQLLRFHAKDTNPAASIDCDVSRIHFVHQNATASDKDSLYMNALQRITIQFENLPDVSGAWYLQAQWWATQAAMYDPLKDTLHRYDFMQSINMCSRAVKNPDSSEGKSNCEELLANIRRRSFQLNIEGVNIPDLPFRVLVSYKNIHQLYGRLIRMNESNRKYFSRNYQVRVWKELVSLPFVKSFQQPLPETSDYQPHRVEIKVDALEPGQYALLTSSDAAFSDSAVLGFTSFFSSSIAFIVNGFDYFVVDRDSGKPLQGVKVKAYTQKYNNGEYNYKLNRTYQGDLQGHFKLTPSKEYGETKLEFYFGKDYLSNESYSTYYRDDDLEIQKNPQIYEEQELKDNLFTDRSIYRPGQIVYFKGLLMTRDFNTKRYKSLIAKQIKLFLVDGNDQKVDSVLLQSNAFGSVHGKFTLPINLLNGEFKITDDQTGDQQSFSVEEYKRPTFYVKYDSLKGSYQVGDTIQLMGAALAYAGNSVDAAKITWRVTRESRFPYPWMFRFFPSRSESEMAHGESVTGANGKFKIQFSALPDKKMPAKNNPVYTYRATATVTDGNGESRSETTTVAASYQSFEIVSSMALQSRLEKDSLRFIPITTNNASGYFLKEKLTVRISPLDGNRRLIRNRYWAQPDQFVLSEADFIRSFPNDEYRNETDIKSWKALMPVYETTDSTTENGLWLLDPKKIQSLPDGDYVVEMEGKDRNGELIIDKRYIELTTNTGKSGSFSYNRIPQEEIIAQPGASVQIHTGSDAGDVFVVRSKQFIDDSLNSYSFYTLSQQINSAMLEIHETERGGFSVNDVFVKNNRWYVSTHLIQVPWTNKSLNISYQTWKDKILPGSQQQWKVKISGYQKDAVIAEVLTSMYDASLDQFKTHSWNLPDLYRVYNSQEAWEGRFSFNEADHATRPGMDLYIRQIQKLYDQLIGLYSGNVSIRMRGIASVKYSSPLRNRSKSLNEVVVLGYGVQNKLAGKPDAMVKDIELEAMPYKVGRKPEEQSIPENSSKVQIRKNFNETAFFQPDLKTDSAGNVEINFTMPEALTKWKWMLLANTKDLSFGYSENTVVTQKELMIQTNMPRFFRQGDTMLLPVKIVNLSAFTMTGTVQLEWLNVNETSQQDQLLGNINASQPFTVNAGQSTSIFFPTTIPSDYTQPLLYRIIAKTNSAGTVYSDGEQSIIPVLSNRMLVTESLPLNMDGKQEKHFVFEKLSKSKTGGTLRNQSLTVEFTTNPAWYAVQSLPYLMEFPHECAEQTFNRFYANALATHIVKVSPTMEAILAKWRDTDTAALLSNLQKNEELKSVLLRETPWVLDAQTETRQKKNLALLFDLMKMRAALKSALTKLQQMQTDGGGFAWFKGGRDDRYITQYIISGIGRLRKLKAIPQELQTALDKMVQSAIPFLDKEINKDYAKRDKLPKANNLDDIKIQYLNMRSYFPEMGIPANKLNAYKYYRKQSVSGWIKQSVYMQSLIALYLYRTGDTKTAKDILASLKENATRSDQLGMYWKSVNSGYYWQQAPVETESQLIETFQELDAAAKDIDQMKYWLLQQKRTSHWSTTKATADACYALLLSGSDWISTSQNVAIQLGDDQIASQDEKSEAGTGYFKKQFSADQIKPEMGNITVAVNQQPSIVNLQPTTVNPSWGAVYWQYFENLDKITSAGNSMTIRKSLWIEKNSAQGPVLEAVTEKNILKPGDKLKMRIIITSDRDLEYVHLNDKRAACLEPANVLSGYQWQGGLGYYQTTKDESTSFFFDHLSKGTYVFEYQVFVTTAGHYSNGISSLECMYAPEFAAHSEGIRIQVESK